MIQVQRKLNTLKNTSLKQKSQFSRSFLTLGVNIKLVLFQGSFYNNRDSPFKRHKICLVCLCNHFIIFISWSLIRFGTNFSDEILQCFMYRLHVKKIDFCNFTSSATPLRKITQELQHFLYLHRLFNIMSSKRSNLFNNLISQNIYQQADQPYFSRKQVLQQICQPQHRDESLYLFFSVVLHKTQIKLKYQKHQKAKGFLHQNVM